MSDALKALRKNTWTLDEWYAQDVAGNAEEIIEGEIWMWGNQEDGSLGQNQSPPGPARSSPAQIPGTTWYDTGDAVNFSAVTKSDGTLWAWGPNPDGRLGLNDRTDRSSPTQVGTDTTWHLTQGTYSSYLATKTDNTLWGWGANHGGAVLGQNNNTAYSSPVQIGTESTWDKDTFSLGVERNWALAVKTDGTLWSWGDNEKAGLGQNNTTFYSSPKQVGTDTTWALGYGKIAGGLKASGGIKTDGTLWTWGNNSHYQLGTDIGLESNCTSPKQVGTSTDWKQIWFGAVGSAYAIKTDGALWVWGSNGRGDLGLPTGANPGNQQSPRQLGTQTTWKQIGSAKNSIHAVKTDGTLWSWGRNEHGQVGSGNRTDYESPRQIGTSTDWSEVWGREAAGIARKNNT